MRRDRDEELAIYLEADGSACGHSGGREGPAQRRPRRTVVRVHLASPVWLPRVRMLPGACVGNPLQPNDSREEAAWFSRS